MRSDGERALAGEAPGQLGGTPLQKGDEGGDAGLVFGGLFAEGEGRFGQAPPAGERGGRLADRLGGEEAQGDLERKVGLADGDAALPEEARQHGDRRVRRVELHHGRGE